ncbi:MAG: nucleoside recognition protein [Gammaproteobacteria bacterium]|nr:nucleoside recognition protein [Gammaproteobacteria bacterium]
MLNIIWLGLIILSVVFGVITGKIPAVVASVTESAKFAFELALGLTGIMSLWLGIMRIAEEAGFVRALARAIRPLMRRIFPDVPVEHPAMGAMVMNIAANMLGLGNAATPFGLKAMAELETLNPRPGVATNAMCTFLAINTSSVQLIPTSAIAFLAAAGAAHPTDIIITSLVATTFSTMAGIIAVKFLEKTPMYRLPEQEVPYDVQPTN